MSLCLVNLLNHRIGNLSHTFSLALEESHSRFESHFCQSLTLLVAEIVFIKRNFHCQCLKHFHLGIFVSRLLNCIGTTVPDHICDIHTDTFSHQRMTTFRVNYRTLLVHHVIVFQQTLTDTEVVFFHLLLSTLDGLGNHAVFNHLTFLESQFVHIVGDTVGSKQTHQVVFQRHEEYRRTRVTLTTGTTTQLTVYTAGFVTFRTDDSQTTCSLHLITQLDIGTTTCHVGSNGYRTALTGLSHDVSFFLVQFGIQYIMLDLTQGKHLTQSFRDFNRSCTYQYRTSGSNHLFNFFDDCLIFFTLGLVHTVVHIDTCNRTVGRNHYYIQFVDVPEFTGFCLSRTCHTRKLVVHTEVILKRNGCESLCRSLYLHTFLRFYCLVQAVAPAASVHDTTGLFVHDLHLTVHYHIVGIFFKHRICLKQLVDGVYTFRLHCIVGHQFILLGQFLFVAQSGFIFQCRKLRSDIRQHKQCRIL